MLETYTYAKLYKQLLATDITAETCEVSSWNCNDYCLPQSVIYKFRKHEKFKQSNSNYKTYQTH